jgi:hypothetical protein
MAADKTFEIRKFQAADRRASANSVARPAFSEIPSTRFSRIANLFADYLSAYYTDWEPESAFVLLMNGEIRGYLLGSRHPFSATTLQSLQQRRSLPPWRRPLSAL